MMIVNTVQHGSGGVNETFLTISIMHEFGVETILDRQVGLPQLSHPTSNLFLRAERRVPGTTASEFDKTNSPRNSISNIVNTDSKSYINTINYIKILCVYKSVTASQVLR